MDDAEKHSYENDATCRLARKLAVVVPLSQATHCTGCRGFLNTEINGTKSLKITTHVDKMVGSLLF